MQNKPFGIQYKVIENPSEVLVEKSYAYIFKKAIASLGLRNIKAERVYVNNSKYTIDIV